MPISDENEQVIHQIFADSQRQCNSIGRWPTLSRALPLTAEHHWIIPLHYVNAEGRVSLFRVADPSCFSKGGWPTRSRIFLLTAEHHWIISLHYVNSEGRVSLFRVAGGRSFVLFEGSGFWCFLPSIANKLIRSIPLLLAPPVSDWKHARFAGFAL